MIDYRITGDLCENEINVKLLVKIHRKETTRKLLAC